MFGLFKKKENKLPLPTKEIPMPKVKEPRFLTRGEMNKISQEVINSKPNKETCQLIKYIEDMIMYYASRGVETYEYRNLLNFHYESNNIDNDIIKKHFEDLGYSISFYDGGVVNSISLTYHDVRIRISWE